jgi:DNA-binding CsgD family transcriptional regulator
MEVQALTNSAQSADAFRYRIGSLIGSVGTGVFEQSLFDAAHIATRCSHMTAFISAPKTAPRALLAADAGGLNLARSLADRYIRHYWHLDPANDFARSCDLPAAGAALHIRSGDIGSTRYRSECYTEVHLGHRFSLIQRSHERLFRINFYSSSARETFDQDAVRSVLDCADLLIALVVRHESSFAPAAAPRDEGFAERLRMLQPRMTNREIQVCDGIARGLTSEGIAIEYGISMNTVLTYRKRAYARLGISSQNELLRYVLRHH